MALNVHSFPEFGAPVAYTLWKLDIIYIVCIKHVKWNSKMVFREKSKGFKCT